LGRRLGAQLAQQSMGRWSIAFGVLILAVSGLFGGLDPAPPKPPVTAGTEVDGGPWRVTIVSARLAGELPRMSLMDDNNHWIAVTARIDVTADESWRLLSFILRLNEVDGIANLSPVRGLATTMPSQMRLKRDNSLAVNLHPGLPEEVEFFWERTPQTVTPQEIKVNILGRKYRADSITGYVNWMEDPDKLITVAVPLRDERSVTK
jgi:hypothetical protein